MTDVADALGLVQRGWPVFPAELVDGKKIPIGTLVEHGFRDATTNHKRVALWWRVKPDALIGVAMPKDTVALDVDSPEAFDAAGLELPEGPGQETPRGGYHKFFSTDGRPVRQTVKEIPGSDTRVGGLGYVIAWQPEQFPEVADLPAAPEWLYGQDSSTGPSQDSGNGQGQGGPLTVRRVRKGRQVEVASFPVGERDNALAREAGFMRQRGYGPPEIFAVFKLWREQGRIESPASDPMTDKDLQRIAGSIGTKQSDAVDRQHREPEPFTRASDLRKKVLRELEYPIHEIFPEGLGIVAGAPKVGKSWLTFQAAVQIACGSTLLGRSADKPRPVLYYGLEDGERRFQKRMRLILETLHPGVKTDRQADELLALLALRYEAPAIGEGLEDDICDFIDSQGGDAVVFIDVLAKIRPQSKGRGSAYDEDYGVIGPLQTIIKDRPGSALVVVTHDRKMGSDDFLTTVTGTRGVVGAADWIWVVKRPRLEDVGTIYVTGRDIERDSAISARFEGLWSLEPRSAPSSLSPAAQAVWTAIDNNKPCDLNTATDVIYGDVTSDPNRANHYNGVSKIVANMEPKGYVKRVRETQPYLYVAFDDSELVSKRAGGLVPAITRSTAASRAGTGLPAHEEGGAYGAQDAHVDAPYAPHAFDIPARTRRARVSDPEVVEPVEPVEVNRVNRVNPASTARAPRFRRGS